MIAELVPTLKIHFTRNISFNTLDSLVRRQQMLSVQPDRSSHVSQARSKASEMPFGGVNLPGSERKSLQV